MESNTIKLDHKTIKWICYDIAITIDNHVFNLYTRNKLKERLVNGSYGYTVNGLFRTKKWIRENCSNVFGFVSD